MRNIIVTGASRGLGLAIATTLAGAGERVIGIARQESEAFRAARAALEKDARGALAFQAFDLTDTHAIGGLVGSLREQYGAIYGLVNNAGLGTGGLLSMMREEQIETLVRLNTLAPIILTRHAVRSMMVERAGRIVNIASVVVATGFNGLSVYAATKASLIGFTRSLAREVGQLGITVNAVAPGFIDTEMTGGMDAQTRDRIVRRSALRRLAEPADIAAAVEFLISERARNITGVTLTVDAGGTA
ncbi:MAG TPA: SDR family oxidoreductase [Steroidobacteraceae bacterium]|nr:SDR family oxidoreductase [Steroidobacteraceae bacterium]